MTRDAELTLKVERNQQLLKHSIEESTRLIGQTEDRLQRCRADLQSSPDEQVKGRRGA